MSPALTFSVGLLLLILFGWYFATDFPGRKRWLGLVLSVLLVAFCLEEAIPPCKKDSTGSRPSRRDFVPDKINAAK